MGELTKRMRVYVKNTATVAVPKPKIPLLLIHIIFVCLSDA